MYVEVALHNLNDMTLISSTYHQGKLQVHLEHMRWLAKITYWPAEGYDTRELIEIGKSLTKVPGIQCAWLHPNVQTR